MKILQILLRKSIIFSLWFVIILISGIVISLNDYYDAQYLLSKESEAITTLASQRADQHDAHLTSLSAIATAGAEIRRDLFLDVAETIIRFYPRIVAVDLVSLSNHNTSLSTKGSTNANLARTMIQAARQTNGSLQLRPNPIEPQTYLLIKRSPNSQNAKYALALTIDGAKLLETDTAFWNSGRVKYSLSLPKDILVSGERSIHSAEFSKQLGSVSQPLTLNVWSSLVTSTSLPWEKIFVGALFITILYSILILGLKQYSRTRRAEKTALLSAQETRLAHASRVNALGEMASGLAHELTQPLTAILSQSQAGKHLATRGDAFALSPVLDDTIKQAKRASAILERMRRWTKPNRDEAGTSSLVDAIHVVDALLQPEAKRQSVSLFFDLSEEKHVYVQGNSTEIEQVIFNLVRNAFDAVEGVNTPTVNVQTSIDEGWVSLIVSDNGIGLPEDIKDRIFEPFVTGKSEGTGLGLALCQRLVEQMDGDITVKRESGRTVFTVILPLQNNKMHMAAQ